MPSGEGVAQPGEPDLITGLMAQVAFTPETVEEGLDFIFDWIAEKRNRECYRLTDRRKRIVVIPTAQMANVAWSSILKMLPGWMATWCETIPGFSAFILGWTLVGTPMVMEDIRQTRREREAKNVPRPGGPQPVPVSRQESESEES